LLGSHLTDLLAFFQRKAMAASGTFFGHGAMSELSPLCDQQRTSSLACIIDPAPTSAAGHLTILYVLVGLWRASAMGFGFAWFNARHGRP
jgi:hypothetical protein